VFPPINKTADFKTDPDLGNYILKEAADGFITSNVNSAI